MEYAPDARSIGELFSDLTVIVGTLIRSEVALARTELSDKVARVGRHAAVIAGGAVIACGGVFAMIAGLVLLVWSRAGLPGWAAALVVGAAVIAAGGLIANSGLSSLRREDHAEGNHQHPEGDGDMERLDDETRSVQPDAAAMPSGDRGGGLPPAETDRRRTQS